MHSENALILGGIAIASGLVLWLTKRGSALLNLLATPIIGPAPGIAYTDSGFIAQADFQNAGGPATFQVAFIFSGPAEYTRLPPALVVAKGARQTFSAVFSPTALEVLGDMAPGTYDMTVNIWDVADFLHGVASADRKSVITLVGR